MSVKKNRSTDVLGFSLMLELDQKSLRRVYGDSLFPWKVQISQNYRLEPVQTLWKKHHPMKQVTELDAQNLAAPEDFWM